MSRSAVISTQAPAIGVKWLVEGANALRQVPLIEEGPGAVQDKGKAGLAEIIERVNNLF